MWEMAVGSIKGRDYMAFSANDDPAQVLRLTAVAAHEDHLEGVRAGGERRNRESEPGRRAVGIRGMDFAHPRVRLVDDGRNARTVVEGDADLRDARVVERPAKAPRPGSHRVVLPRNVDDAEGRVQDLFERRGALECAPRRRRLLRVRDSRIEGRTAGEPKDQIGVVAPDK